MMKQILQNKGDSKPSGKTTATVSPLKTQASFVLVDTFGCNKYNKQNNMCLCAQVSAVRFIELSLTMKRVGLCKSNDRHEQSCRYSDASVSEDRH